jgi:hypothetical protein
MRPLSFFVDIEPNVDFSFHVLCSECDSIARISLSSDKPFLASTRFRRRTAGFMRLRFRSSSPERAARPSWRAPDTRALGVCGERYFQAREVGFRVFLPPPDGGAARRKHRGCLYPTPVPTRRAKHSSSLGSMIRPRLRHRTCDEVRVRLRPRGGCGLFLHATIMLPCISVFVFAPSVPFRIPYRP